MHAKGWGFWLLVLVALRLDAADVPAGPSATGALILSPRAGSAVRAGQSFRLTIDAVSREKSLYLRIWTPKERGVWDFTPPIEVSGRPPLTVELALPWSITGPFFLEIDVTDLEQGGSPEYELKHSLVAVPDPQERPDRLELTEAQVEDLPDYDYEAEPAALEVRGDYGESRHRDLSLGVFGTRYRADDERILRVDADGRVIPVAPGFSFVTVDYAGVQARLPVAVHEWATRYIPPKELTDSLDLILDPALIYDAYSNRYQQYLILRNRTKNPLPAVRFLVFENLTEGVEVERDDRTKKFQPLGSRYVELPDWEELLMPGASRQLRLEFRKPSDLQQPIRFRLRVFSGSHI